MFLPFSKPSPMQFYLNLFWVHCPTTRYHELWGILFSKNSHEFPAFSKFSVRLQIMMLTHWLKLQWKNIHWQYFGRRCAVFLQNLRFNFVVRFSYIYPSENTSIYCLLFSDVKVVIRDNSTSNRFWHVIMNGNIHIIYLSISAFKHIKKRL